MKVKTGWDMAAMDAYGKVLFPTAVKAFYSQKNYINELECYVRLSNAGVQKLGGFFVPVLEGFDDSLMVIEVSIVEPPYLLDFGKVYIDTPPPYHDDPQLMANAHAEWREWFGRSWIRVAGVLGLLQTYGIYYVDPRPSNICTGDTAEESVDWSQGLTESDES